MHVGVVLAAPWGLERGCVKGWGPLDASWMRVSWTTLTLCKVCLLLLLLHHTHEPARARCAGREAGLPRLLGQQQKNAGLLIS